MCEIILLIVYLFNISYIKKLKIHEIKIINLKIEHLLKLIVKQRTFEIINLFLYTFVAF